MVSLSLQGGPAQQTVPAQQTQACNVLIKPSLTLASLAVCELRPSPSTRNKLSFSGVPD